MKHQNKDKILNDFNEDCITLEKQIKSVKIKKKVYSGIFIAILLASIYLLHFMLFVPILLFVLLPIACVVVFQENKEEKLKSQLRETQLVILQNQ
jgi:hypothetical protein